MARKGPIKKAEIIADTKFNNKVVSKFINAIMMHGKKAVAEKIIYGAIDQLSSKGKSEDGLAILNKALENVKPKVEVKSRRVGGATYQVPVEVKSDRQISLAMRWIIEAARKRNENSMTKKLAGELMDASENRGSSIKKREDTIKMAEANKAFSHFRW